VVFLALLPAILAQNSEEARVGVDTSKAVAETDANYICATIDWWPQDKCNYNRCPWGSSSVLNLVSVCIFGKGLWLSYTLLVTFMCGY